MELAKILNLSPSHLVCLTVILNMAAEASPHSSKADPFNYEEFQDASDHVQTAASSQATVKSGFSFKSQRVNQESSPVKKIQHELINLCNTPKSARDDNDSYGGGQYKDSPMKYDFFGNALPEEDTNIDDLLDEEEEFASTSAVSIDQPNLNVSHIDYTDKIFHSSRSPVKKNIQSPAKNTPPLVASKESIEIGNFRGNIINHGTTGEFDGFKYAHSKIMLSVIFKGYVFILVLKIDR